MGNNTNITVVVVGHFVQGYLENLKVMLHSLPLELKNSKILINYDTSVISEDELAAYVDELEGELDNIDADITTYYSYGGLISSIANTIYKVKTEYMVLLEHDWIFLERNIDFKAIKQTFHDYNFVNIIYFSKENNVIRGYEVAEDVNGVQTPYEVDDRIKHLDLVKSCRWSNNPGIVRVNVYRQWFEMTIRNDHMQTQNQRQYNVEEKMIKVIRRTIASNDYNEIKDMWGTYVYGGIGDEPYVAHSDTSMRYIHKCEIPEMNAIEYKKRMRVNR